MTKQQRHVLELAIMVGVLLILAGLWRWTPLKDHLDPNAMVGMILQNVPRGHIDPPIAAIVFALAGLVMVPVTLLIFTAALLFTFWEGVFLCVVGVVLSSVLGYLIGRLLGQERLNHLVGGQRINQLKKKIGIDGVVSVISLRLLPVAPFTIVNFGLGSVRIPFWDFLVGTLIGTAPGIVLINYFETSITAALRDPSATSIVLAIVAFIVLVGGVVLLKKVLRKSL
jgi:uncharacterized membrane protein YdjX (TVP38/TMEM64 family)